MKMSAIKDICKCTSNADNAICRGSCSPQSAVYAGYDPWKFFFSAAVTV